MKTKIQRKGKILLFLKLLGYKLLAGYNSTPRHYHHSLMNIFLSFGNTIHVLTNSLSILFTFENFQLGSRNVF
ncbi:hypothetical protein LINGRAHAP2_LOCUS31410 [Linum grandiflorum]